MDRGLLVVFLATGFWLYGAILLAAKDWRWNPGRIILFVILTGVGTWLLLTRRTGLRECRWLLPLFAVTMLLPLMVQRCIAEALSTGRISIARYWQWLLAFLTWRRPSTLLRSLGDTPLPTAKGAPAAVRRRLAEAWTYIYSATSRIDYHARRIDTCVNFGRYAEAVELYRKHFGMGGLAPPFALLCTVSIACGEIGNLADAAASLRRAVELPGPHSPLNMRRFAATVRLYSLCGRANDLEQFVLRNSRVAERISPAGLKMWQGIAHLNAGNIDRGKAFLLDALSLTQPREETLRQAIQKKLYTAYPEAPREPLPEAVARELEAIRTAEKRAGAKESFFDISRRPIVTWWIVAAIVLAFALTEWVGSSSDGFTLIRLGANMPDLVKHGEWWRLMTSVFLHVDWIHLFFNACACYIFGVFVERAIGRMQMLTVFLVSGFGGSIASALFSVAPISAGASGAAFGLLGAATMITLRFRAMFPPRLRRILIINFLFIAFMNLAYGYVEPRIDNLAHGGGLAAGLLAGCFVARFGRAGIRKRFVSLVGVATIALLAASAALGITNAMDGGYPQGSILMKHHEHPSGEWSVNIPAFWRVDSAYRSAVPWMVVFDDCVGAAFAITRYEGAPEKLEPGPNDEVRDEDLPPALARRYEYRSIGRTVKGKRIRQFWFQRSEGKYTYRFLFECAMEDADRYRWLVYRIMMGFRAEESRKPDRR